MFTSDCSERRRLDVLRQLFASATHEASAAMCQWTDSLITLTLDDVIDIPLEDVCAALNLGDERLTMVALSLDDDLGGAMVLAFDERNGRQLAASLLGAEPGTAEQWSELERSALSETGNILGCAYVNAVTRLINRRLIPSVPFFIQDYGASVVEQAVLGQASSDRVLICRTGYHRQDPSQQAEKELAWWVLFVPSESLCTELEKAIGATV